MNKSPDAFRTISEVAESLDTPAHVLRFWESRLSADQAGQLAGGGADDVPGHCASDRDQASHDEGPLTRRRGRRSCAIRCACVAGLDRRSGQPRRPDHRASGSSRCARDRGPRGRLSRHRRPRTRARPGCRQGRSAGLHGTKRIATSSTNPSMHLPPLPRLRLRFQAPKKPTLRTDATASLIRALPRESLPATGKSGQYQKTTALRARMAARAEGGNADASMRFPVCPGPNIAMYRPCQS